MKRSEALQYVSITILVILIYMVSRILGLENQTTPIQLTMIVFLVVSLGYYIYLHRKDSGEERKLSVIICMGMVMRIGYMLYTSCQVRGHDLWEIDVNAHGHAGYILTLMEKHQLPDSNALQLYQAPFFYMTGAVFSKVINGILNVGELFYLVDATKTVSCAASCISLLVCKKIYEVCNMSLKAQKLALVVMAFLPATYLIGGRVNPDALATMFMMLAFLYTLRFFKEPSWKNTIILAIIYGLGVMTKVSCAVVAFMTALLFLGKLYEEVKKKKGKEIILKYLVFGCISLPLGLWYGVRNYVLFQQPLNYVLELPETISLYTGEHSIVQRILGVDFSNFLNGPYVNLAEDYNAPVYYLKTALFGEFSYNVPGWIPMTLLLCATIVAVGAVIALVWQFTRNQKDMSGMIAAVMFIMFYGSVLFFYCKYPFSCSMDFRYMVFCVMPLSIVFGKYMMVHQNIRKWVNVVLWIGAISSCLMYCLI